MTDLHEASFKWPAGPSKVIVTGEFDDWSHSTELTKTEDGFTGTFHLPWGSKSAYKYLVDGEWSLNPAEPQEPDEAGNVNNVYTSPPKPEAAAADPPAEPAPSAPAVEKTSMDEVKDNAASIVSYMASGLGAAFANVTGIDPINPQQIPIEDEKAEEPVADKPAPGPEVTKDEPAPTIETAQEPVIPEAPVEDKKPIVDPLAPILDEPVVLNLLPTTTSTISHTATTVVEKATEAATTVKESVPTTVEEVNEIVPTTEEVASKLPEPVVSAAEKVQETVVPATEVAIPDAPEPYKEPAAVDSIAIPDAVEPYKATNGTLPGETAAEPSKVYETAEKVEETVVPSTEAAENKASGVIEKAKDAVAPLSTEKEEEVEKATTPPASPVKHAFPGSSEAATTTAGTAQSVASTAADGTPKRKKRQSIFGKLKEVFTHEKQNKTKVGSTAS